MIVEWVGSLGTAIVGFTGIIATYRSGNKARISQATNLTLHINAENDRCRLADKRRIYASFMGAVSAYVVAEHNLAAAVRNPSNGKRLAQLRAELNQAMTNMLTTLCELRLIAPQNLAEVSVGAVRQLTTSRDIASEFPELRNSLYEAMRTDLGEPIHERLDLPEIAAHALER